MKHKTDLDWSYFKYHAAREKFKTESISLLFFVAIGSVFQYYGIYFLMNFTMLEGIYLIFGWACTAIAWIIYTCCLISLIADILPSYFTMKKTLKRVEEDMNPIEVAQWRIHKWNAPFWKRYKDAAAEYYKTHPIGG